MAGQGRFGDLFFADVVRIALVVAGAVLLLFAFEDVDAWGTRGLRAFWTARRFGRQCTHRDDLNPARHGTLSPSAGTYPTHHACPSNSPPTYSVHVFRSCSVATHAYHRPVFSAEQKPSVVVKDRDHLTMDEAVVMPAQQNGVGEICAASRLPRQSVMNLPVGNRIRTPRITACSIPGDDCSGLRRCEQTFFTSNVHHFAA